LTTIPAINGNQRPTLNVQRPTLNERDSELNIES
jgi:hypothetical protein